jgi:lipopolysaccharide/colanic/teichoic acid biosynthesis glycosyltransferase/glycosyltransferase involved in cell wall biosynthesis
MRERGHEVTVLIGGRGPVREQLEAAGVPVRSLRWLQRAVHPVRDVLAIRELMGVLREVRPCLVSTHTAKAGLVGRAACARLGIPAVYTPHGWTIGSRISPVAGPVFSLVERYAAAWSAAIVCVCEAERTLALEHGIGPAEKLRVIYNGMPDLPPGQFRAEPAREPVRLCSVARLEAPKDHATLLRALAGLAHLDWELELIGDGPLGGALRALAASLDIGERVRWRGYLPEPAAALSEAQVFVLSTRSEAFPRSILEAMRAGLPVVASAVGGIPEAVEPENSGLLVAPGNVETLREALRQMVESASLRQRCGDTGRQIYQKRFRFETMAEQTLALYQEILGIPTEVEGESAGGTNMRDVTSGWNRSSAILGELPIERRTPIRSVLASAAPAEEEHDGLLGGFAPWLKRVFDIVSAVGLLTVAVPLGVLIAAAIRLETRGPVFYRQIRIGRGGRLFSLWKFRSMAVNSQELLERYLAEHPDLLAEWEATHKLKDDPRVTRVGRFLRRRSLDELPQLWNVLKGDMSLIGPRPIVDEEVPKYGDAFALYRRVKPGLTGLWQVSGRSDLSYRRRVELDSHYIRHWSLWLDMKVIWKTVGVLLRAHGAY